MPELMTVRSRQRPIAKQFVALAWLEGRKLPLQMPERGANRIVPFADAKGISQSREHFEGQPGVAAAGKLRRRPGDLLPPQRQACIVAGLGQVLLTLAQVAIDL